jgi:hypothetical protein
MLTKPTAMIAGVLVLVAALYVLFPRSPTAGDFVAKGTETLDDIALVNAWERDSVPAYTRKLLDGEAVVHVGNWKFSRLGESATGVGVAEKGHFGKCVVYTAARDIRLVMLLVQPLDDGAAVLFVHRFNNPALVMWFIRLNAKRF